MKSATQVWFGAGAWKSRLTRSPARVPSLPGTVVRTFLARRTPRIPSWRIRRTTVQRGTSWPRARSACQVLRYPYRLSGDARPSAPVRRSTNALTRTASLIVRAAGRRERHA